MVFAKNLKQNKQIALAILAVLIASNIGLLALIGLNLNAIALVSGITVGFLLGTAGLAWVAYGIHKKKIRD